LLFPGPAWRTGTFVAPEPCSRPRGSGGEYLRQLDRVPVVVENRNLYQATICAVVNSPPPRPAAVRVRPQSSVFSRRTGAVGHRSGNGCWLLTLSHFGMETTIEGTTLRVVQGNITEQAVDAIVNAANRTLLGGGGVDGAIHRHGGPSILAACREIRRTEYPDGLPTGHAVVTTAGALPARWVIHTVGPIWYGGQAGEAGLLALAYRNSLERAREVGARSVAFPSISTGAYGYPLDEAASLALSTLAVYLTENAGSFDEVRMVAFSTADADVYQAALRAIKA
jgi:O-acetyl-ADP-ribose deacetylase